MQHASVNHLQTDWPTAVARHRCAKPLLAVLFGTCIILAAGVVCQGDDPPVDEKAPLRVLPDSVQAELAQLIRALDAADFDDRADAAERLTNLAAQKELAPELSDAIDQVLLARGTSFEVRTHLHAILAQVPTVKRAAPPILTAQQV